MSAPPSVPNPNDASLRVEDLDARSEPAAGAPTAASQPAERIPFGLAGPTLALALVLSSALGCREGAPADPLPLLAVRADRLVDGTGSEPIDNGVVLIRGDRVVAAGPAHRIPLPPGTKVIDGGAATILPGLVDAHVHLTRALERDPEAGMAWLRAGVTALVDMGSPLGAAGLRERLAELPAPRPRVLVPGPILTAPGGYPFAGPGSSALEISPPEAPAILRRLLAEERVDHLKVAIDRGFASDLDEEGWPVPDAALLAAIAGAARSAGRRVSAHVTQPGELAAAVDAGFHSAAHTPIEPLSDELLRRAADRGFVLISTLSLWRETPEALAAAGANLRRYLELGGRVALGTDAPAFHEPGLPREEIRLLLAAGLTPLQVLVAATRDAAAVGGWEADRGTLEPGRLADLIVVAGSPLEDGLRFEEVRAVILGGRPVSSGF